MLQGGPFSFWDLPFLSYLGLYVVQASSIFGVLKLLLSARGWPKGKWWARWWKLVVFSADRIQLSGWIYPVEFSLCSIEKTIVVH
jgi:hypothetical protein